MYFSGFGAKQSFDEARKYYDKGCSLNNGNPVAKQGYFITKDVGLSKLMMKR